MDSHPTPCEGYTQKPLAIPFQRVPPQITIPGIKTVPVRDFAENPVLDECES
jgi:hypothetical protein